MVSLRQWLSRRRDTGNADARFYVVRGLPVEVVVLRLVSGETPELWRYRQAASYSNIHRHRK